MRSALLLTGLLIGMQAIPEPARAFDERDLDKLRETGSCEGCNLRAADLSGLNLLGANLRGAYMHRANLRGAKLRNADLSNADLSSANLREADLRDANLTGTQLNDSNLAMTNLRGANIRDASLFDNAPLDTAPANETGSAHDPALPHPSMGGKTNERRSEADPRLLPDLSSDSLYELDFQPASGRDESAEARLDETNPLLRFIGRVLTW